jgi:hypothetical protein
MAATITKLKTRGRGDSATAAGGPTVRAAIDAFLDSPKIKGNPNTARAYTGVLDRIAGVIGAGRKLASEADGEIADALAELWGKAARAPCYLPSGAHGWMVMVNCWVACWPL